MFGAEFNLSCLRLSRQLETMLGPPYLVFQITKISQFFVTLYHFIYIKKHEQKNKGLVINPMTASSLREDSEMHSTCYWRGVIICGGPLRGQAAPTTGHGPTHSHFLCRLRDLPVARCSVCLISLLWLTGLQIDSGSPCEAGDHGVPADRTSGHRLHRW